VEAQLSTFGGCDQRIMIGSFSPCSMANDKCRPGVAFLIWIRSSRFGPISEQSSINETMLTNTFWPDHRDPGRRDDLHSRGQGRQAGAFHPGQEGADPLSISPELLDQVDEIARRKHLSRAALVTVWLGDCVAQEAA
jgi:hypothetical protein